MKEEDAKKEEPSDAEFGEGRTERCIELMRPEVRKLLTLSLDEKIKETEKIIRETVKKYKNPGIGFSGGGDSEAAISPISFGTRRVLS